MEGVHNFCFFFFVARKLFFFEDLSDSGIPFFTEKNNHIHPRWRPSTRNKTTRSWRCRFVNDGGPWFPKKSDVGVFSPTNLWECRLQTSNEELRNKFALGKHPCTTKWNPHGKKTHAPKIGLSFFQIDPSFCFLFSASLFRMFLLTCQYCAVGTASLSRKRCLQCYCNCPEVVDQMPHRLYLERARMIVIWSASVRYASYGHPKNWCLL